MVGPTKATPAHSRLLLLNEDLTLRSLDPSEDLVELLKLPAAKESKNMETLLESFSRLPVDRIHHYAMVGDYIRSLRMDNKLVDVLLDVGGQVFGAHRIALACHSKYFAEVFLRQGETFNLPYEMTISGITAIAFQTFLKYIYMGEIAITPESSSDLMLLAEKFKMPHIMQICMDFVESMPPEQALQLLSRRGGDHTSQIYQQAYTIVLKNFSELFDGKSFLLLPLDLLCQLLGDDYLFIATEMDVFWAGLKWIAYHITERQKFLVRVMKNVRFPLISQTELFQCFEVTDLLRESIQCRHMVLNANWIITAIELDRDDPLKLTRPNQRLCMTKHYDPHSRPMIPMKRWGLQCNGNPEGVTGCNTGCNTPTDYIDHVSVTIQECHGGDDEGHHVHYNESKHREERQEEQHVEHDEGDVHITESHNALASEPEDHGDHEPHVSSHSLAELQAPENTVSRTIVAVGGFRKGPAGNKDLHVKDIARYSSSKNKWQYYTGIPEGTQHQAIAVLNMQLYLIGGSFFKKNKKTPTATNTCYLFDPSSERWSPVASMKANRMYHCVCALKGRLYAIAGQNEKNKILKTVEAFNPTSKAWKNVAKVHKARFSFGAASCNGKIYVVGGLEPAANKHTNMPVLKHFECYDPKTNQWSKLASIRVSRCLCTLVAVDTTLYLCGGATRTDIHKKLVSTANVDAYDTQKGHDNWHTGIFLDRPRHQAAATVIGKRIYIIGGTSSADSTVLKSIECYDLDKEEWDRSIVDLPYAAKGLACAVLPLTK